MNSMDNGYLELGPRFFVLCRARSLLAKQAAYHLQPSSLLYIQWCLMRCARLCLSCWLSAALLASFACTTQRMPEMTDRRAPAATTASSNDPLSIHQRAIVVDMHADTVQRMIDEGADINQKLQDGHFDAVRAKAGGLDAQFFSIWVEPEFFGGGGQSAIDRADKQIAAVRALATEHPETWELATTAADVRRIAGAGRIAALM